MPMFAITNRPIEVDRERDDSFPCTGCDAPSPGVHFVRIDEDVLLLCRFCLDRLRAAIEGAMTP